MKAMLSFVLVVGRNGGRVPAHRVAGLDCGADEHLAFVHEQELSWANASGSIVFRGWQRQPAAFRLGSHWQATPDRLVAFAGIPLSNDGPWQNGSSWAEQIASMSRSEQLGPSSWHGRLRGSYSLVELNAHKGGCVVSDALGGGLLYQAMSPEVVVISNRSSLAGWALGDGKPLRRDVVGMGWLLTLGSVIGPRSGIEGVEALPGDAHVEVAGDGRLQVRRRPGWFATLTPVDPSPEELTAIAQPVAREIQATMAALSAIDGDRRLGLTGGRDSRLLLAAALASGVEHRFTYQTTGPEGSADIRVARRLAAEHHLAHNESRGSGRDAPAQWLEDEIRVHAHRTCGLLPAKQLSGKPGEVPWLFVDGCFGESMRAFFGDHRHLRHLDDVDSVLQGRLQRWDRGGLCPPETEAFYLEATRMAVAELADGGVATENLLHALFVLEYDRRDIGVADEAMALRPRVHPLQSVSAVAAAFRIGHEARRSQRLHLEVLRCLFEPLARVPLANKGWPDEALSVLPGDIAARYRVPPIVGPTAGLAGLRGSSLATHSGVFERWLLDDPTNPVFDVVDRRRVVAAVRHEDTAAISPETIRSLYNVLGVAVWLREGEARSIVTDAG